MDLFAAGPATVISLTSSYSETGVLGEAELASAEKGRRALAEAAKQFANLVVEFAARPKPPRGDHHAVAPTMPFPWGQDAEPPTRRGDVHGEYVRSGRSDGSERSRLDSNQRPAD